MARNRKRLKLKPVLFIACEGTSTEFDYFESWAQEDSTKEFFQAINVYPGKDEASPKTNPHQLIEIAKKELENGSADIAWVVFDKDGHPLLGQSFTDAKTYGINIAFSSRSFEEWVLMHYEKNNFSFQASECKLPTGRALNCGTAEVQACTPSLCLSGHIRRQGFIFNYSKKKDFDLFSTVKHLTEKAIVNSAWLRFQSNASLNMPQSSLHTINPYTDVDQLIFNLQDRSDKIEWGIAGTNISLSNWTINVSISNGNIVLRLSHTKPQAQLLNTAFIASSFYTTDDNLDNINCIVISKQYVSNINGSNNQLLYHDDIIEYTLKSSTKPYFLFKDDSCAIRIYVVL